MTPRGVAHGLLALTALWLSLPDAVLAEDRRSQLRPQPSTIQVPSPRHQQLESAVEYHRRQQQLAPAVGYHSYSPPPPSPQYDPGYRPPPPSSHHHYPHGHRLHVHGPSCAVVAAPHGHVRAVPIWQVYIHPQSFHPGQATLQIIVTAAEGDIYVDDHYLGSSRSLQGQPIDFQIIPGWHIVSFVHRGHVHPHEVYVEADLTTVVQASLR